ncbi:Neuronal acetylcholine receptor subunit alpha-2 [Seminavis robusta]|uniref:Neuronal acetylcholine receptor subunit alpha-2 n=1 Tax=Seminavis robusta TaxID=568900 RepID=A0A9N8HW82_9STRA|nr:Neuronal acetylcholine receptor subunit alpha-2 [Seminavis robusta]|eukprot:Sro1613_g286010.1 Neuronal acetylcholine receptor subunit alpha-2 (939) ;mRNA; f:9352-12168
MVPAVLGLVFWWLAWSVDAARAEPRFLDSTVVLNSTTDNVPASDQLPEGWSQDTDPSTGKVFYYHVNGTTAWEMPVMTKQNVSTLEVSSNETVASWGFTNFRANEAFQFANIFLVGGVCNDPSDWYSIFTLAANETLGDDQVTKVICYEGGEAGGQNTREFHVAGLEQVVDLAGDQLNETLVITLGMGLSTDWTPVVELLKRGMAFWHASIWGSEYAINLEQFGLDTNQVLYLYFEGDEKRGARGIGKELCRLRGGGRQLTVAKVYQPYGGSYLNFRIDDAMEAFRKLCPDTELVELWEINDSSDLAILAALRFREVPEVILTTQDYHVRKVLEVAERVLLPDQFGTLAVTGWDNHPGIMDRQNVLATVDPLVLYPNLGLWTAISEVTNLTQQLGLNSTTMLQTAFDLPGDNAAVVQTDVMVVSSDPLGFASDNLLTGYQRKLPPSKIVPVSTGLYDVSISEMMPFDGQVEAVVWLKLMWYDHRLKFNLISSRDVGSLPVDRNMIWTPSLYVQNSFQYTVLYEKPALVYYHGLVVLETNVLIRTLCATTESLRSYPFDSHDCSIDLTAPAGVCMDHRFGFEVVSSDDNFDLGTSLAMENQCNGTYIRPEGDAVYYQMHFERRPFTAYVRVILPAIIINVVGFMTFWIENKSDSVGLGITSLLCALTFRETVEIPSTSDMTWSEVFLMINIVYQALVMIILFFSYAHMASIRSLCCCLPGNLTLPWTRSSSTAHAPVGNQCTPEPDTNAGTGAIARSQTAQGNMSLGSQAMNCPPREVTVQGPRGDPSVGVGTNGISGGNHAGAGISSDSESNSDDSSASGSVAVDQKPENRQHVQPSAQETSPPADGKPKEIDVDDLLEEKHGHANVATGSTLSVHSRGALTQNSDPNATIDGQSEEDDHNVDWIGRWFVVPSYIIVMIVFIAGGGDVYNSMVGSAEL